MELLNSDKIAESNYVLSLNVYKEEMDNHVEHIPPLQLISELKTLEDEIQTELKKLEEILK